MVTPPTAETMLMSHAHAGDHHQGGPGHGLDGGFFIIHIEDQEDDGDREGNQAHIPFEGGTQDDHHQETCQGGELFPVQGRQGFLFLGSDFLDFVAFVQEIDHKGKDDGGHGGINQYSTLVAGDSLGLGQVPDQDTFRGQGGEPSGHGSDFPNGGQHHRIVAGGLGKGQTQSGYDPQGRHTAGTDGGDDVADQVHDDGGGFYMASGQIQEFLGRKFQGPVVGGNGAQ